MEQYYTAGSYWKVKRTVNCRTEDMLCIAIFGDGYYEFVNLANGDVYPSSTWIKEEGFKISHIENQWKNVKLEPVQVKVVQA